jgi:murein L,D-transpeptidase YcbB/YkuD
MLTSAIDAVVLNPPWNVPEEIAKEEILPKAASDPDYLAAHNYEETSDGAGGTRIVQKPAADSALGLVKFDFKNPFAVYMHDTPSKAAFSKTQRSVSHGCVRLANAMAFAKLLLGAQSGWSPERIDQVIASGQTTNVPLSRHVPVELVYLTAFPDNGRIAFRPDVYGWDGQMLEMLDHAGGRTVASAQAQGSVRG